MIGKQERWQEDLFVAGPLSSLVPDDHILKRVDAILDLSWLSGLVKATYCSDNGRRSIDPESALRLMWVLIIVLTHWIGALIYYFVRRPRRIELHGK